MKRIVRWPRGPCRTRGKSGRARQPIALSLITCLLCFLLKLQVIRLKWQTKMSGAFEKGNKDGKEDKGPKIAGENLTSVHNSSGQELLLTC